MNVETITTSSGTTGEFAVYVHVETRAERLMRHSNFLACIAVNTAAGNGVPEEKEHDFLKFLALVDELAALSRLFEVIDGTSVSSTEDQ